jgi:molybdate/tungstate transport system substrate-binding protein
LAEKHYNQNQIIELLQKDLNYVRPKEVDLLSLLEIGAIDYIFIYRSVAQQHSLEYIVLPDEINLKSPKYGAFYKTASVKISGKKPNEFITKNGEPMIYGLTIPDNSQDKLLAIEFTEFFLSEKKGMKIIERNGQKSLIPAISETFSFVPNRLKKFAKPQ